MMRRWTGYLVVGCIVLIFFYHNKLVVPPKSPLPTGIIPEKSPFDVHATPTDGETGRFQWSKVETRYPVKSLIKLPQEQPKRLPKVQFDFSSREPSERYERLRKVRQQAIKEAFARCWKAYEDNSWLSDELAPLSGRSKNTFGGWAATLVDSLDTLWIMDMKDEFYRAVKALDQIDFTRSTHQTINVFETTIRYLGGFLSAYDLSNEPSLLAKAVEMAEMLYVAFDTPNRLPVARWDFARAMAGHAQLAPEFVLSAEIGSLTLEFTRLSQLTGDPRWFDAVQRITHVFREQQSKTKLPGMWPIAVNARKPDFAFDKTFSLGAMADSLYEYFPKMHALLGGLDPVFEDLYTDAISTAESNLFFKPMTPTNANILLSGLYIADRTPNLDPTGQHLVCFVGGMLALGSRLFDIPAHMLLAHQLVDGCIWTYKAFPSGIMPEVFRMQPCPPSPDPCAWNESAWLESVYQYHDIKPAAPSADVIAQLRLPPGFTEISDRRYILRPEAIESVFLLYRITGRQDLPDTAWDMFSAIDKATRTTLANAALADMTAASPENTQKDSMESFWLAETLKYFYLIFSEPDVISLDDYVFNTEAHPLKRPKGSI